MLRTTLLASIGALQWTAIGPGPDPRVLLDAVISLNDVPMRLRAVRVFAPWSAGWTQDDTWEMDPADVAEDIAWDVTVLRQWVRLCDELPDSVEMPQQPQPAYSEAMLAVEDWWQQAMELFYWDDAEYPPVLIDGMTYQIIGYPCDPDTTIVSASIALNKAGWGNDTGEPGFRDGVIECSEAPFRLFGYEMLGIHGQQSVRHRALNRKDEEYLAQLRAFVTSRISNGQMQTTLVNRTPCLLFIQPMLRSAFRIVESAADLVPVAGQMRWFFPIVPVEVASIAEALGRMIRARHMAFHENRPIIIGSAEELVDWLPVFVHPTRVLPALRKATTIAAFGIGCGKCNQEHVEPLVQDASGTGGIFYVEPSAIGLHLLDDMQDNQLMELLTQGGHLHTPILSEDMGFPKWTEQLPRMFDRQYRQLWDAMPHADE